MQPVRGKKVMIQSVLLCCKDFFQACGYTPPYAGRMKELQFACIFPPSFPIFFSFFSLLKIIRLQSGLRGVTFLLTFP